LYRLVDHLALDRRFYPSPIPGGPNVLVIDIPVGSRGAGLALGRYYPVILETEAEVDEFDRFLQRLRPKAVRPDIFDHRPSAFHSEQILVTRFEPPELGWPWASICKWPDSFARSGLDQGLAMARGCYTMELFERGGP